jgi:hypothetical protein
MDFHPFTIDASWYDAHWLVPGPSERPARTGRLTRIVRLLFPELPATRRAEQISPGRAVVAGATAGRSFATHA